MTDTKVYNGENQRRDVETELTENNFHDILTNWTFSETKVVTLGLQGCLLENMFESLTTPLNIQITYASNGRPA